MTLTQVTSQAPARVVVGGSGPGVLVNRDLTNIVYTGPDFNYSAGDPTSSIHDPLIGIPYDGETDVYAIAPPGVQSVLMDFIENADNWTPSPAQAAQQINALGLATATNQTTQIGHEANTDTNTNSTTQALFGTSFGVPSALVDTAGMSVMDTIYGRVNLLANGDFRRGTATWSTTNCTQNVVSSGLPNGWPRKFGNQLTPSGSATSLQLNGPTIPCQPNQIIAARGWFNQAAQAVGETVQMQLRFVNSANTVIATVSSTKQNFVNQVQHLDLTGSSALATVAGVRLIIVYTGASGNIPAADVLTVGDLSVHSGSVAGMPSTANDIANTGAPLLKLHTPVTSVASTVLTLGTPVTLGPFNFNQIGYSLFLDAYVTSGAVLSYLEISIVWLDAASGLAIDQQIHWINVGSASGSPHGLRIVGPTEGNQVQITLTAFGSGVTVTNFLLFQSSTPYARHFPLTTVMTTLAGVANVAFNNPLTFLIGDISATALATGTNNIAIPAYYSGRVLLFGGTTSGTTDMTINISNTSDQTSAGSHTIWQDNSDAKGFINTYLSLPRSQCVVTVTNQNAGSQSCRWTLVAAPEG